MNYTSPRSDRSKEMCLKLPVLDPKNPKDEAAIKLQKVYKSFRARRKLADCAVLVEQSWCVLNLPFLHNFFLCLFNLVLMKLFVMYIGGSS